ncbi:MAG: peptidylprolyl isomerase [Gammaproteobacteria bacterium]|nr:MAG: peptidylprolyl isomerase [Gammaproteobacteria bacterium]|tara:strand:+ start:541 stop:1161 length:621 start_codon:yes stop_codon:yes gene_type:complete
MKDLKFLRVIIFTFFALSVSLSYAAPRETVTTNIAFKTSKGDIIIELYNQIAPITVDNFLRHLDGGHYDGSSFYRTVTHQNDNGSPKIEVIQGGLGDIDKPFPAISHESTNITKLKHEDGTISMSRGEVNSATSDFFICIGSQQGLDFGGERNNDGQGFAAFGKVIEGMDIVRDINGMPSNKKTDNEYVKGQMINNPIIIEKAVRL